MTAHVYFTRFHGNGDTWGYPERAKRTSVMLTAFVEHFAGPSATSHRVRDLSVEGVRIDNATMLKVGATLVISVGSLRAVGATVKWVDNGFAGLAFAERINLDDARSNAIISPSRPLEPAVFKESPSSTAGWIDDPRNPHRR